MPAELAAVVAKMMEKEPGCRFQTPAEVARALTPFKTGKAASRGPKPDASPAGSPEGPAGQVVAVMARAPVIPDRSAEAAHRQGPSWESLIEFREMEGPVGRKPPPAPRRRPPWLRASAGVGVLLLGLIGTWAVGVIKVKTPGGTIVLENLPDQAEVSVDGEDISVQWPGSGNPMVIAIPAGKHEVRVKKHGFTTFGRAVSVEAGGKAPVVVRLEPLGATTPKER